MSRVLHRKLRQGDDCALLARDLRAEHVIARIGVLACFPPGPGLRSAQARTFQDRPRGGVMERQERKAGSRAGLQGQVRGRGKLAGGQGLSGPLPSVEVHSSVRVPLSGNRQRQAGRSRIGLAAPDRLRVIVWGRSVRRERYRHDGGGRSGGMLRSRNVLPVSACFGG